jgi:hypothetical protein
VSRIITALCTSNDRMVKVNLLWWNLGLGDNSGLVQPWLQRMLQMQHSRSTLK